MNTIYKLTLKESLPGGGGGGGGVGGGGWGACVGAKCYRLCIYIPTVLSRMEATFRASDYHGISS